MKIPKPLLALALWFAAATALLATVPSSTTWVQYVLTTSPQTLTVPFVFQSASDLLVLDSKASPPVTLTLNSDYSVSGGSGSTGTITTIAGGANAVAVGDRITISRRVPLTQTTTFTTGGVVTPAMIGQGLDKLTTIAQQLNLVGANSLQFQGDEQIAGVLSLSLRKNAFLAFDANGVPWFPTTASIVGSVANPIVAGSIAALRIIPVTGLTPNAACQTAGYYSPNDGGGGTYVWNASSTATDNGGTVIQPTGITTGRWILLSNGVISVRQFGCKGDGSTSDTAAFQNALNVAGRIAVPPGTYMAEGLTLSANTILIGVRDQSIIKGITGTTFVIAVNPGTQGSSDPTTNTSGIELHGITVQGRSDLGFSEFVHNMIVSAASNVLIENCSFTAFQGDGIYLGCYVAATERHDEKVTIRNCVFDGVNKLNRNAITVIDCTQLFVEDCTFQHCTTSTMPGAIDIEPNNTDLWPRIRDVFITDCRFYDVGGTAGAINMTLIAQTSLTTPARHIVIRGNTFDTVFDAINLNQTYNASSTPIDAEVSGNLILTNSNAAMAFQGMRGLKVVGNVLAAGSPNPIYFATTNTDVIYANNKHLSCEMAFDNVANFTIDHNTFTNAGNNTWVFTIGSGKTATNFNITNNIVDGSGWTYLFKDAGATWGTVANKFFGNTYGAITNQFQWYGTHSNSATVSIGSLTTLTGASATISVPGCLVGDAVILTDTIQSADSYEIVSAHVSVAGTVIVLAYNPTAGTRPSWSGPMAVTTISP